MNNIVKHYIISISLVEDKLKKDGYDIKGWDGKSNVYFQNGGYGGNTFTIDPYKGKEYTSLKAVKNALDMIHVFYGKYLYNHKAKVVAMNVKLEKNLGEIENVLEF